MEKTNYEKYFNNLVGNLPFSRLGKTFKTKKNKYFYDVGTGKVLQCENNVFDILQLLEKGILLDFNNTSILEKDYIDGLKILKEAVEKENILKSLPIISFTGNQIDSLEISLKQNIQHLCIELTQRCNLRCEYCIYQENNNKFRNFKLVDLRFETAKKAIDYVLEHANDEEIHFGFYGGEPLLKYDLIRECVAYIISNEQKRKVYFSMTTNATLMNKIKAEYFASIPNFAIVFSLDGNEEIHNSKRKMQNGKGSFELALKGFLNAQNAYGERAIEKLIINAVICPPYSNEKFENMQKFFSTYAKGHQIQYSYVDYGNPKITEEKRVITNPIFEWTKEVKEKKELFSWGGMTQGFLHIHKRPLSEEPIQLYRFNGCCVPGSRRIYLTVQGKYNVCERIGESPEIGDVEIGLNYEKIKKYYVEEYMKQSLRDCQKCWVINMCSVCYASCYSVTGIDIQQKRVRCQSQRYSTEQMMKFYHEIMEENPESLSYLNDIIVK